jgi:hypothetical protein
MSSTEASAEWEVRAKITRLFPKESLPSIAAFLTTGPWSCTRRCFEDGEVPTKKASIQLERGSQVAKTFRGNKFVEVVLACKSRGLDKVTSEAEAVALGQWMLDCQEPVCVLLCTRGRAA